MAAQPLAASVTAFTATSFNAGFAFAETPSYFALGELGAAATTVASGTQTITDSLSLTVDLTRLPSLGSLIVGFGGGTASASGFGNITLKFTVNGAAALTQTFANLPAAKNYFTDNAVDLGVLSGSTLTLGVSLTMQESVASAGYDFNLLLGQNASASDFSGGGRTISLASVPGGVANLFATGGSFDTVNGSGGKIALNSAQASIVGGGETIGVGGVGSIASLYSTANNWDVVNGSNAILDLTSAQTSLVGGGDVAYFNGGSGNYLSLYSTAKNYNTVNGSGGTVSLTSAQANVVGGGDAVFFNGGRTMS